jgi:CTP synthase
MGIQPDVIICRSDHTVTQDLRDKIALFCDVESRAVVPLPTAESIYEVPLVLEEAGLGDYVIERMQLPPGERDLSDWRALVERLKQPSGSVRVGIVGKYVELRDAYLSVKESLIHAGIHHSVAVDIEWIHSQRLDKPDSESLLEGLDGIVVPGGFGERGIEGKIRAARYARERGIPYLGLCLGMQVMVVEMARHVFGTDAANSTEFEPDTAYPVISLLSEQQGVVDKGGTMRLGSYPCRLVPGTRVHAAYGVDEVGERHRHRYEFNNAFRDDLARGGLIACGLSPDGQLVEICELRDHPFMVGCQFHPEFRSRPDKPHPLFREFVAAAVAHARAAKPALAEAVGGSGAL